MTLTDVQAHASELGFELDELDIDGMRVWQWRRGSDTHWPTFLDHDAAMSWMDDGLRTASLFNR